VRNLIDRNLLVEAGRDLSSPGSPALLDVTEDFLLATGAKSRDDFPALEDIVDPKEIARLQERVSGYERPVEARDGGKE
jgi:segregation and condensation protein B